MYGNPKTTQTHQDRSGDAARAQAEEIYLSPIIMTLMGEAQPLPTRLACVHPVATGLALGPSIRTGLDA